MHSHWSHRKTMVHHWFQTDEEVEYLCQLIMACLLKIVILSMTMKCTSQHLCTKITHSCLPGLVSPTQTGITKMNLNSGDFILSLKLFLATCHLQSYSHWPRPGLILLSLTYNFDKQVDVARELKWFARDVNMAVTCFSCITKFKYICTCFQVL